jgi:hypothetical protein
MKDYDLFFFVFVDLISVLLRDRWFWWSLKRPTLDSLGFVRDNEKILDDQLFKIEVIYTNFSIQ